MTVFLPYVMTAKLPLICDKYCQIENIKDKSVRIEFVCISVIAIFINGVVLALKSSRFILIYLFGL